MKLIDDQIGIKTKYIIINGNGSYPDFIILNRVCEVYNGPEKIIVFPRTPIKRYSGLSALQSIHSFINRGFYNFIFIVDREHIQNDAKQEIKNKLYGVNILYEEDIQNAFLLKCKSGHREFNLFCNISGLTNCIEEELKDLLELKLNININVPSARSEKEWRKSLKKAIDSQVGRRRIKSTIKECDIKNLENSFPNLCAIFKKIEENYEN